MSKPDTAFLHQFEETLKPWNPYDSAFQVEVLGYGEISTVFKLNGNKDWAYKRMPLFETIDAAEVYLTQYNEYCAYLNDAGLALPESHTEIVDIPGRPIVLYIIQRAYPKEHFCHNRIHGENREEIQMMLTEIADHLEKVWSFNKSYHPLVALAIDGQLSNWVWYEDETGQRTMIYIDTSTPLYRLKEVEQLDPELFLKSAPSFLRWIIRWLFLEEVMNRYYDRREVYKDLAANCFKEQAADYIQTILGIANHHLEIPLRMKDIESYYQSDKLIWKLFLSFRKIDRFLQRQILQSRYEFILPEIEHR
ncbi:MAG: hypothetical protein HQ509_06350 [Candidatus Marinimicrobia bacterium]|nr:hypothetical protein [Candidatus Neomarinimicrobiota bacterium]